MTSYVTQKPKILAVDRSRWGTKKPAEIPLEVDDELSETAEDDEPVPETQEEEAPQAADDQNEDER